jgi:glucosamine--fructose-6-phosphate aminotransferase (isomerizing)
MMKAPDKPIIFRELAMLPDDYSQLLEHLEQKVADLRSNNNFQEFDEVLIIGAGDSHCAGLSMRMLFQELNIKHRVYNPFEFIHYHKKQNHNLKQLLIAISASGNSPIILEGIHCAKEKGIYSLVITGNENAKSLELCDFSMVYGLENKEASPGIRSYQASLLSLTVLSQALVSKDFDTSSFLNEVRQLSKTLAEVITLFTKSTVAVASSTYSKSTAIFLGAGPNYGTALYAAAKMIEGTGIPVLVQELEEWWHIERFAGPYDMDLFIFAPEGNSLKRSIEIAEHARNLGRNVHFITNHKTNLEHINSIHFDGDIREELTPLLLGHFGSALAGHIAQQNSTAHFRKTNG